MSSEFDYSFENVEFWEDVKKILDMVDDYSEQIEQKDESKANNRKKLVESTQTLRNLDNKRVHLEKNVKSESGSGKQHTTKYISNRNERDCKSDTNNKHVIQDNITLNDSSPQGSLNNEAQYKQRPTKSRDYNKEKALDRKKLNNKKIEKKVDPGLKQKIQNLKEFKQKFNVRENHNPEVKLSKSKSYNKRINKDNFQETKREFDDHSECHQKINSNNSRSELKLDDIKSHNRLNKNQPKVDQHSKLVKKTNLESSSFEDGFSKAVPRVKKRFENDRQNYYKEKGSKLRDDFENETVSNIKVNEETDSYFPGDLDNISNQLKLHNKYNQDIKARHDSKSGNKINLNTEYFRNKSLNPKWSSSNSLRSKSKRDSSNEHQFENENKYDKRSNNNYDKNCQSKYKDYSEYSNNKGRYDKNKRIEQTKPQTSYHGETINYRKYDQAWKRRGSDDEFDNDKLFSQNIKKKNASVYHKDRDGSKDSDGYKKELNNRNDSCCEGDNVNHKTSSQKIYKPAFDRKHGNKYKEYKKHVNNEHSSRSDNNFNNYRISNQNIKTNDFTAFNRGSSYRNKGYNKEIKERSVSSSEGDFVDHRTSNKETNKKDSPAYYREHSDRNKGYKKEIKERSVSSSEGDFVDHRTSSKETNKKDSPAYYREYSDRNKGYKKGIKERSISSSEDDFIDHRTSNKKTNKKDSSIFHREYSDRNKGYNKEIKERSESSSEDNFIDHRTSNKKINKKDSSAFYREYSERNKEYKKGIKESSISSSEDDFKNHKIYNQRKNNISDSKSYSELEGQRKKKIGSWKGSNSQRGNIKEYKSRIGRESDFASESEDHSMETSDLSEDDSESESGLKIVNRKEWGAPISKWGRGPGMKTPVPNVFVMPTNKRTCYNKEDCVKEMLFLIGRHMKTQLCPDIKYNFVIGGDGRVYEGRGWTTRPGLPIDYKNLNKFSLFIGLAGKFTEHYFPRAMRDARDEIITYGIDHNYIAEDYKLHSPVD